MRHPAKEDKKHLRMQMLLILFRYFADLGGDGVRIHLIFMQQFGRLSALAEHILYADAVHTASQALVREHIEHRTA